MPSSILANSDLPEYMQGADTGTELMGQYVSPPRVSLVQGLSPKELKEQFGEGAIYSSPGNVLISASSSDTPVRFVPIFFYPEFIEWNPRSAKIAIRHRTFDSNSPLAARCRSFDKKVREYPCPEIPDKIIRCQEHLNFVVMLLDHELTGIPMLLSFSRTGFRDGKSLIDLIRMRRAAMYGLIFDLSAGERKNDEGAWYGFDIRSAISADGMTAYVDQDWFAYLQQQHEEFRANYESGLMQAEYGDENSGGVDTSATANLPQKKF